MKKGILYILAGLTFINNHAVAQANQLPIEEFKLKNGFRELFGNGVYEYLRSERMQMARSLLNESNRSIKEIASMTGYRSVNSFIKAFKKLYGVTPGDFRKQRT